MTHLKTTAAFFFAGAMLTANAADAQPLTPQNGWTGAPFGTAAPTAKLNGSIVAFKGAIAGGNKAVAFRIPSTFRPFTDVYIPADLCNATNGRLHVTPSGFTSVEAEGGAFTNAQCFTSLDGASFAMSAALFTNLTLLNGWTNDPFATSDAAMASIGPILHLKGAIATTGTNMSPFVLPKGSRPPADVYVHIDLCNATNGRLHVTHAGLADVEPENGTISNARCFTSLDGASFAIRRTGFAALTLVNGWTGGPFGTSLPAVRLINSTVTFMGAMGSGSNAVAFTLPPGMRPAANVFVPVDLCNATKGRLQIQPDGTVSVQAKTAFTDAQCFTSLDGVSFAL